MLKTNIVVDNSASLGLNINRGKSKVLKINVPNEKPITVQVSSGSILDKQGGTDADVTDAVRGVVGADVQAIPKMEWCHHDAEM